MSSTKPAQAPQKDLDVTLTATHQVHVSKPFVNSLREEAANKTEKTPLLGQNDEPSAWLDAHGNGKLQL
jgi:hypothetical protein